MSLSFPFAQSVAGLLQWVSWAGDIDQLLQQQCAAAGSATLSVYVGS